MPSTILPNGIRSGHTTIKRTMDGRYVVTLYATDIATVFPGPMGWVVRYDTGGYKTPTTSRRMVEVAHHWSLPAPPSLAEWRKSGKNWIEIEATNFNPAITGV